MKTCPSCRVAYADNITFCPQDGAQLRAVDTLEPGTVIRKKYQIVGEIARGGMGVVYRARHLLWNEDAAIKLLLNVGGEGAKQSAGFLSEALVMRQLQHPNIVRVEDADFTEDDKLFIVMEYVHGESLQQRMNRGPMPCEEVLEIAAQACAGLAAAHRKGIVHRDIKPHNLLLTGDPDGHRVVKLIDFGIAKVREDAGMGLTGATSSATGIFMGTPEYASPEQAMGMRGSELDARTDLYSLGLVMFEMLTGVRPFLSDTLLGTLNLRLQKDPRPPRELRPELNIPPVVSDLVTKAIARERDSRYASAEEMQRAIGQTLDQLRNASSVETIALDVRQAQAPAPKPAKETRVYAIAVAAAVIAAVALAAWFFLHRPGPSAQAPQYTSVPAPPAVTPSPPPRPPGMAVPQPGSPPVPTAKAASATTEKAEKPEKPEDRERPETQQPTSRVKVNSQDELKYVWIPPGKFIMGCSAGDADCGPDESPSHEVAIAKGFWMGQTEVTQAAYRRVIGDNPSNFQGADLPVDSVNWFHARTYCKAVGMRLPTEAEWEYAARGGTGGPRYGLPGQIGWWRANSDTRTHEVAQKQPNAFGLYDVAGNVAEWTADWYGPYSAASVTDPQGPAEGAYRIVRGASWVGVLKAVRVSARATRKPAFSGVYVGFRCAGN